MRAPHLLLALGLLPGCYLSHSIEAGPVRPPLDAGPRPDAGGRPDAGRADTGLPPRPDAGRGEGGYWTLERRDAWLSIPHELGCTQYEGGRVALEVIVPIEDECEYAGPVETEAADDGTLVVSAYLWVHHLLDPDSCRGITAISQRRLLLPAHEGTFRAADVGGGSSVELRIGAIDDRPCSFAGGRDAPCLMDCDCAGDQVCIPQLGDFVMCEGGHCGDPCDLQSGTLRPIYSQHLECEPTEQCRYGLAGGSPSCQPIAGDGCASSGDACGPGLVCPPAGAATECVWELRLSGSNRHPCGGDADCDPGLYCVEHAGGERLCEVPCFSDEMRCPIMHECRPGRWVCEWLGE